MFDQFFFYFFILFIYFFDQFFFKKKMLFLYLFLVAVSLCCYVWGFSSLGEQGLLLITGTQLLIVVASLVAEHRLQLFRHTDSLAVARGP